MSSNFRTPNEHLVFGGNLGLHDLIADEVQKQTQVLRSQMVSLSDTCSLLIKKLSDRMASLENFQQAVERPFNAQDLAASQSVLMELQALETRIAGIEQKSSAEQIRDEIALLHERIKSIELYNENSILNSSEYETFNTQTISDYDLFIEHLFEAIFKHDASTLKQAINKMNDSFLSENILGDAQKDAMQEFVQWLKNILVSLEKLLSISSASANLSELIQTTRHRIDTLLTECTDYAQSLQRKQIELSIPPFILSPENSPEWFSNICRELRKLLKKILDPIGYFTASGDRFVSGDLIAVIDMCDGIMPDASLQAYTNDLITVATLQDTSPQLGKPFDPVNHQVIGSCNGAPPDTVVEVRRRGFRYKGRTLRKASVVIGR